MVVLQCITCIANLQCQRLHVSDWAVQAWQTLLADLSNQFGVPVIDGVSAAVKMVEGLVSMNLSSSRANGYAQPKAKTYHGSFSVYAPAGD